MDFKRKLSFTQIWNMCFGFLGVQFGMGLTLSNMSSIYRYLGAEESELPILWLAGPITGLVVQPLVGALGDSTSSRWGRRKPYYTLGAIVASMCLILMPYSSGIWIAAGLLWFLDGAVNTSMESFRALVGDMVRKEQQPVVFSVQTFMIGIGQLFAAILPYLLAVAGFALVSSDRTVPDFVKFSFVSGAVIILGSVLWTGYKTKEYKVSKITLSATEKRKRNGFFNSLLEVFNAVKDMPLPLRQIWWVKLAIWYALPLMWQYLVLSMARHAFDAREPSDPGFSEGVAMGGVGMAIYCSAPMVMSFLFSSLIPRIGSRKIWFLCQLIGGVGFLAIFFTDSLPLIFVLCFLIGIGYSGIVTMPYLMLTKVVPESRVGVYMGLLNAFICIPQIFSMLTVPFYYNSLLGGDPRNALVLAGSLWIAAGFLVLRISKKVDLD